MIETTTKRIEWLDNLRAIAVVGVIIIQLSMPVISNTFKVNMSSWWIGNILEGAVRFSVPLFFMISGAMLLSRKYSLQSFYKKRVIRIIPPLFFYSLVYLIYQWIKLSAGLRPDSFAELVKWIADIFVKNSISTHFWFAYLILFLYIFIPWVAVFIQKLKPAMIVFLLAAWILVCNFSQVFSINMASWTVNSLIGRLYVSGLYLGYMILGYYLYNIFYVSHNIRLTAIILYFVTILFSTIMVFYSSSSVSKLDTSFFNYLNMNTIIQSSMVFIAFKNAKPRLAKVVKLRRMISKYSFGICLSHVLVIQLLSEVGVTWKMMYPALSIPVLACLTLIVSISFIVFIRKIPFGKYISG